MSPFDDFMSNIYDPVDMFSLKMRGDLFRRIVVRALQYFLTVVDIKELNDIDTTKKKLKALGERLSKTTVVCGTMNSLL